MQGEVSTSTEQEKRDSHEHIKINACEKPLEFKPLITLNDQISTYFKLNT